MILQVFEHVEVVTVCNFPYADDAVYIAIVKVFSTSLYEKKRKKLVRTFSFLTRFDVSGRVREQTSMLKKRYLNRTYHCNCESCFFLKMYNVRSFEELCR